MRGHRRDPLKKSICFFAAVFLFAGTNAHAFDRDFTPSQKAWALNIGTGLFITTWGVLFWDYGQNSPRIGHERWFQNDTKEGGADKLAHAYTNYALVHGFAYLYESWGYHPDKAALYGALSSFGGMAFMEVGDSFSDFGFSYEDLIMNTIGSGLGYLTCKYPQISRKVDFRIEYVPNLQNSDIFTDYSHQKFLMAVKLDGFDWIRNRALKYLDLHFGYFARGYSEQKADKNRTLYVGVGVNLSKLFDRLSYPRISRFLNFYQVPYTYVSGKHELN